MNKEGRLPKSTRFANRRTGRALVVILLLGLALTMTATANSTGRQGNTVHDNDGCICHSLQPNPGTKLGLQGVPAAYEPGTKYTIKLSSTTDVIANPVANQGGFLAFVTAGTLSPVAGAPAWYRTGQLNGSEWFIEHNLQGVQENRAQRWEFVWTSPKPGVGPVAIKAYANRVNGDSNATADDHWNRWSGLINGPNQQPAAPSSPKPGNPARTPVQPPPGSSPPDRASEAAQTTAPASTVGFETAAIILAGLVVFVRRRGNR